MLSFLQRVLKKIQDPLKALPFIKKLSQKKRLLNSQAGSLNEDMRKEFFELKGKIN